jgi:hypothetical protein
MTTSKRNTKNNGWNLFLSIILSILLILILLYVIMAIYLGVKYNNTKKTLEHFTRSNMEILIKDIGSTYDFTQDPGDFKDTISKMSKDMMDSLLSYYDGNLNTVVLTVRNLTSSAQSDDGDFSKDARYFASRMIQNIPLYVLYRSVYLPRFFGLIYLTLEDDKKKLLIEQIVKEIKDILDKFKPTPN